MKSQLAKNIYYCILRATEANNPFYQYKWTMLAYTLLVAGIKKYGAPEEVKGEIKKVLKDVRAKLTLQKTPNKGADPACIPITKVDPTNWGAVKAIESKFRLLHITLQELIYASVLAGFDDVSLEEISAQMAELDHLKLLQGDKGE